MIHEKSGRSIDVTGRSEYSLGGQCKIFGSEEEVEANVPVAMIFKYLSYFFAGHTEILCPYICSCAL